MFILIQAGKGSIVSRDRIYPMEKGTLCFIGGNKYHYTFPDIPEKYIRSKLFIPSEELERVARLLSYAPELSHAVDEDQITTGLLDERELLHAEELLSELNALSDDPVGFRAKTYSTAIELTLLLSRSRSERLPFKFDNIQTAVEYINRHITEAISIDSICAACYLSKYHFCRLFKEKLGLTVMEYILKTRIAMAKELLSEGERSVTEISEVCGFSSLSYFSRVFKESTGMTPLQYKRLER